MSQTATAPASNPAPASAPPAQTASPPNNAVVKKFKPEDFKKPTNLVVLKQMGASLVGPINDALPGFLRNGALATLRALYTECQKNPGLLDCTPESLFGATICAAQMGLQIGGALGQCYLIPFKGRVTLVPGYKGYIQLVNRSGQTGVINAFAVYDKDDFHYEFGTSPKIVHRSGQYSSIEEVRKRKAVAYYATCTTRQGPTFVVLTREEAEFHREKFALSQKGPWSNHFDAMAMKTCIIKLCKYLPMSAEIQTAIHVDETSETDEPFDASFLFQDAIGYDDTPTETKAESLANRLAEVKGDSNSNGQLFPNETADTSPISK
ncbi:MAG: recombinase RecT [Gemmataceae bacterium]